MFPQIFLMRAAKKRPIGYALHYEARRPYWGSCRNDRWCFECPTVEGTEKSPRATKAELSETAEQGRPIGPRISFLIRVYPRDPWLKNSIHQTTDDADGADESSPKSPERFVFQARRAGENSLGDPTDSFTTGIIPQSAWRSEY
jgi:hypothetical protein